MITTDGTNVLRFWSYGPDGSGLEQEWTETKSVKLVDKHGNEAKDVVWKRPDGFDVPVLFCVK